MSLRYVFTAIALAVAVLGASAPQAADTNCVKDGVVTLDGSCWNSLRPGEKVALVQGFWAGSYGRTLGDNLINDASYPRPRDWLEIPSRTTTQDIIDYFNLLYKTPANRSIQWDWAYILAAMNARDDDTDDRLSLIRFLRDYGSIPTSGQIVGVKAPDIITVKAEQGSFDIHLEGVTSKGLSDDQRKTAIGFLRGISRGDTLLDAYSGKRKICENPPGMPVWLVYQSQFFQGGQMLSAMVTIGSYTSLCLDARQIKITELDPAGAATLSGEVRLNELLVSSGLAFLDEEVDPSWARIVADARDLGVFAELAKKQGLYIHGPNHVAIIDEVVDYGSKLPSGN